MPPTAPITPNRPIFLTGAPRSGTSWLGEVLSAGRGVRYLYEPLNYRWAPRLADRLGHFAYYSAGARAPYFLDRHARRAFSGKQSKEQLFRSWYRGYLRSAVTPFSRLMVKDPTAVLMTDWISEQFNPHVVVTVRHPCGFASSIVPLGWDLSLARFLKQRKLMADHLEPHTGAIRRARGDNWTQAAALWSMIHVVLANQLATRPDWIVSDFESLCTSPESEVEQLCRRLGLDPDGPLERVRRLDVGGRQGDPGSTRKQTAAMPDIWKSRMTQAEVDAVLGTVADFGLAPAPGIARAAS